MSTLGKCDTRQKDSKESFLTFLILSDAIQHPFFHKNNGKSYECNVSFDSPLSRVLIIAGIAPQMMHNVFSTAKRRTMSVSDEMTSDFRGIFVISYYYFYTKCKVPLLSSYPQLSKEKKRIQKYSGGDELCVR